MECYEFDAQQRALMEQLQMPFAIYQFIDKRVVTLILSDGFCELFGYTDRALAYQDMDHDMYKDTHPDDTARIAENPVTGTVAVAIAVLSVTDANEGTTYASIARALAADYYNIYYVDLETERFIEYSSSVGGEELAEQGVFTVTYRLVDFGTPVYVNMKAMRMQPDGRHLIIGISIVDSQMKQQEMLERVQREQAVFARVMALSGDYLSLYTVETESSRYYEYNATSAYQSLGFARTGDDFFRQGIIDGKKAVCPEDLSRYLDRFNRENVLRDIREKGAFQLQYRLMINGIPQPVTLTIVRVTEHDGEKLIAGVRVRREQ